MKKPKPLDLMAFKGVKTKVWARIPSAPMGLKLFSLVEPCRLQGCDPKEFRFRCLIRKPLRFKLCGLRFKYLDLKSSNLFTLETLKVKGLGVIA